MEKTPFSKNALRCIVAFQAHVITLHLVTHCVTHLTKRIISPTQTRPQCRTEATTQHQGKVRDTDLLQHEETKICLKHAIPQR